LFNPSRSLKNRTIHYINSLFSVKLTHEFNGLFVFYAEIGGTLVVNAQELSVVNGVEVLRPLEIAMNSDNITIVKGMITAFHLGQNLALVCYGSPVNYWRANYLGRDYTEPCSGQLVCVAP
jgi:hypothetical protein